MAQVASAREDSSIVAVKQDVEETTRDFVVKALAQETKGHPFASFVAHVLNTMGYRTRVSPEGTDGGIDIVAHRDELGFEPPIVKVQVKSTEGKVGDPEVSALYGKVGSTEFGLVVTLGYFTPQAITFARNKSNLRLIDGDELVELDPRALRATRLEIQSHGPAQAGLRPGTGGQGRRVGLSSKNLRTGHEAKRERDGSRSETGRFEMATELSKFERIEQFQNCSSLPRPAEKATLASSGRSAGRCSPTPRWPPAPLVSFASAAMPVPSGNTSRGNSATTPSGEPLSERSSTRSSRSWRARRRPHLPGPPTWH